MTEKNQEPRIVEITHTVKASEAAGRRLMKNIDTGETFWEGETPAPLPPEVKPKKTRGPRKK